MAPVFATLIEFLSVNPKSICMDQWVRHSQNVIASFIALRIYSVCVCVYMRACRIMLKSSASLNYCKFLTIVSL